MRTAKLTTHQRTGDTMNPFTHRKMRIALILLLSGILLYSLARLTYIQRQYQSADTLYATVRSEIFHPLPAQTADAPAPSAAEVDFDALFSVNADILGWIWIPDTNMSYPLLAGEDNERYLTHAYDLTRSASGSIFMDARNASSFTDDNTIIYGHNMKNGSMFGSLKAFADSDYAKQHEYIYLFTADTTRKYQIFAAHKTDVTSKVYARTFSRALGYGDFIAAIPRLHTPPPPGEPALLTLSTCTTGKQTERFVVHATLADVQRTQP